MNANPEATVTVLTKSNCPACKSTLRVLDQKNVDYQELSLEDPLWLGMAKEMGAQQAPVVIPVPFTFDAIAKCDSWWTGFRPDKLVELG